MVVSSLLRLSPHTFVGSPLVSAFQTLVAQLERTWPTHRYLDVGVVIGVSGGADSVALARTLVHLRAQHPPATGFLTLAHLNHGLRGAAADGDEEFVRNLASQLEVDVVTQRATGLGTGEESLRKARMSFLIGTTKRIGARYIALAHHREDNVETVLHHLFRGTGVMGLAGMAPTRVMDEDFVIVRPFLNLGQETLRSALRELHQPWREDASNLDTKYTRNWIRLELLPLIQQRFPDAIQAIERAILGQRETAEVLDELAQKWLDDLDWDPDTLPVLVPRDARVPPTVVIRAMQKVFQLQSWPCQAMTATHWRKLADAITGPEFTRFTLPGGLEVDLASPKTVRITPPGTPR